MKFRLPLLTVFLLTFLFSKAQNNSISGVVTDAGNSRPLTGATIVVQKMNKTATSDNTGTFKFTGLATGSYTLTVSYVGYTTKEISGVEVIKSEPATINISLDLAAGNQLNEVVVRTDARRENLSALLNVRRNSAVVSDFISADMIRRSPDKNTSDVLKRVSGTTIQDNKFVVVRGMNDRYNEALLNGALLPSSEPDRKTFAFDIFPSEIVDNITIIKSASPDLPGSFAGGLIEINTKEAPDKNFISVRGSISDHTITTGKDYYDYKGGKTDWLGKDDGTRQLPKSFPDSKDFTKLDVAAKEIFARKFSNNWAYYIKPSAPLNYSYQAFGGFTASLGGKNGYPKLSGIMGVTYTTALKYSHNKRYDYYANYDTAYNYTDSVYNTAVLYSGMANFSFKLNPNNKFFFNNLYSVNSNDQVVMRSGPSQTNGFTDIKANSFFFTANKFFNSQLGGDHFLPKSKLRIRWQGYYTNLQRSEPDYRRNLYYQTEPDGPYSALISSTVGTNSGVHYFAHVLDKTAGGNVDLSLPFKLLHNTQTIKFGGGYYDDTRARSARYFVPVADPESVQNFNNNLLLYGQDSIYAKRNFNTRRGFLFDEYYDKRNHYDGFIKNTTAYVMLDDKITRQLRLIWGVRMEDYHNVVNTFDDTSAPFKINKSFVDFLPSANLVYSVLPKANIRASYSKTVARPLYRELVEQIFYDFLSNTSFSGNPDLTETHITNFDVRWEQYFPSNQYYSVSLFYKRFINPTEAWIVVGGSDSRQISYTNFTDPYNFTAGTNTPIKANNYGVEVEFRKNFDFISQSLKNLSAYANVSFINSKTNSHASETDSSFRPLVGQSPYIANAMLQYNDPKTNLGITALYNIVGPRLLLIGGRGGINPVYEKVHPVLDVKLSKTFLKNGLVELSFADILHKDDVQYWDVNNSTYHKYSAGSDDRLIQDNTYGMNVTLSVGYRF